MVPITPSDAFQDKFKKGESYEIPLNHGMLRESYPSRGLELRAIYQWAEAHHVKLRSEASLEIKRDGDQITSARILTYDYIPEVSKAAPSPCKSKPVLEAEVETEEMGMGW